MSSSHRSLNGPFGIETARGTDEIPAGHGKEDSNLFNFQKMIKTLASQQGNHDIRNIRAFQSEVTVNLTNLTPDQGAPFILGPGDLSCEETLEYAFPELRLSWLPYWRSCLGGIWPGWTCPAVRTFLNQ